MKYMKLFLMGSALMPMAIASGMESTLTRQKKLFDAIASQNVDSVRAALQNSKDIINMPYEHERNTPLRAAYYQGAVPVLDFLIESGADKRQLAGYLCVSTNGQVDQVKWLLSHGINDIYVTPSDLLTESALEKAVEYAAKEKDPARKVRYFEIIRVLSPYK